ncbi:TniB family NTP-binding protein [Alcaligenes aquatilis]|uniref:TniB family NTP-binding protein n=1 Tax=Alcaligenes aquatilis TaxID=323284 RepID=UPI003D2224F1
MREPTHTYTSAKVVLELLQRRISHPRIKEVIDEIEALQSLGPNHILMVTGPTGVGKTTLAQSLLTRILKSHAQAMQQDAGLIPVLLIEARATSEAEFNWKLFYADILEQLEVTSGMPAGVEYGVDPHTNRVYRPSGRSKNTAAGLRKKVERALQHRGVKVLMIDEGGHFTNVSEVRMKRQTDALKSLSNCAGCQIILFGSYDILSISRLSAQLARRIKEIHFARYRSDSIDDSLVFERVLQRIEHDAQGFFGGLLLENAKLLHANTLGCVGTLMDVIRGFASRAQHADAVTQALLERCLLTEGQHLAILEEIRQGELRFESEFVKSGKARKVA